MSTQDQTSSEKAGGRAVLFVVLGLLLLVAAAWTAAYFNAGDKVPRGTTVEGVGIGGRTQDAAAQALERGLRERADGPIRVIIDGERRRVDPADAGLSVDYAASVADAGGEKTWDPTRLWDYYTRGDDLDAVVTVDEAAMDELLMRLDSEVGSPPREGAVTFDEAQVRVVNPRVGVELDAEQARGALEGAYLQDDSATELTLVQQQPDIDADDLQQALEGFANPAVSAPVSLVVGDSTVSLEPRDFSPALRVTAEDGELVPGLDEGVISGLLDGVISGGSAPVDATVVLVGGRPQVVPARPGVSYDTQGVADAFLKLVTRREGRREMEVEARVAKPEFSTADARGLRIREQVSTFTTYYPYAEYRNVNIGRAAESVTGTVLKPGETFSLNETVGERTRANGFTEGFIISDGIFKEDLGGGVSQMATTLFNGMFFAGLEDVEHKPHSFYIDRYPVGREATVAWGAVDLRFRNDTPYGVLVDARVTPATPSSSGVATVSMWSTRHWDITTSTSGRYDFTPPETRTLKKKDCYPNEGYKGFEVDVTRFFRKPGESTLDHDEVFHTVYTPSDTVICVGQRGAR